MKIASRDHIVSLVDGRLDEQWAGTATDLYNALSTKWPEKARERKAQGLPTSARGVSAELKRIAPALRQVGIDVKWERRGKSRTRIIILEDGRKNLKADAKR